MLGIIDVFCFSRKPSDELSQQIKSDRDGYERSISKEGSLDTEYGPDTFNLDDIPEGIELDELEELSPVATVGTPLCPILEEEEEGGEVPSNGWRSKWQSVAERSLEKGSGGAEGSSVEDSITSTGSKWGKVKRVRIQAEESSGEPKRPQNLDLQQRRKSYRTPFLSEGETHMVWRPKKRPQLANLVDMLQHNQREVAEPAKPATKQPTTLKEHNSLVSPPVSRTPSLRSRQKTLFNRVIATQAVLKEHTDELLEQEEQEESKPRHLTLLEASKKVTASLKKQKSSEEGSKNFSDIVSQYLTNAKASTEGEEKRAEPAAPTSKWGTVLSKKPALVKRDTRGAISIQTLRDIVREEKIQAG